MGGKETQKGEEYPTILETIFAIVVFHLYIVRPQLNRHACYTTTVWPWFPTQQSLTIQYPMLIITRRFRLTSYPGRRAIIRNDTQDGNSLFSVQESDHSKASQSHAVPDQGKEGNQRPKCWRPDR